MCQTGGCKKLWYFKWWVMGDEWWAMSDENWVMNDEWWVTIFLNQTRPKCYDAVNSPDLSTPGAIKTTTDNILSIRSSFVFSAFDWVRRACNCLAHHVAKFSLCSLSPLFFNKDNLPPAFLALCKEDYPLCSSFLS